MGKKIIKIVDTNVLLRFFVGDNKEHFLHAKNWFKEAQEGKMRLVIKPLVVAETCFVLESFYKKGREEIAEVFEVFLSQRWLKVEEREILLALWVEYIGGLHFVDSFLLTWVKVNEAGLLSFDKDLLKKV
jgi:predicted nucleic-acid-binding protein